jgi:hypothetical protein
VGELANTWFSKDSEVGEMYECDGRMKVALGAEGAEGACSAMGSVVVVTEEEGCGSAETRLAMAAVQ